MNEEQKRDFKGVWIPKEVWLHKELSLLERNLFAEIDSLDNENGCTAGNEYFAEFFGVSIPTITRGISKLRRLKFIRQESFNGRNRVLRSNLKLIPEPNQNDEAASSKRLSSIGKMTRQTHQNDEHINSYINTSINNNPPQNKRRISDNSQPGPENIGHIDKNLFNSLRDGIYRNDLFHIYDNLLDIKSLEELVEEGAYKALKKSYESNSAFFSRQGKRAKKIVFEELAIQIRSNFPYKRLPGDPTKKRNHFVALLCDQVAHTLSSLLVVNEKIRG